MEKQGKLRYRILILALVFLVYPVQAWGAEDSGLLWLVNSNNKLEASYGPQQLVYINGFPVRPEVKAAFIKMQEGMRADGIKGMRLQSAYRPYQYQRALFDLKLENLAALGHDQKTAYALATLAVALPGASEHQIGLAIDVSVSGVLNEQFANTEAGVWIQNHSHQYGFIVRYPKEKTDITRIMYEPWHLRYIGLPHSMYMNEYNMCLEEYIDHVKEAGILLYWLDEANYFKISYSPFLKKMGMPLPPKDAYDISSTGFGGRGYVITELKKVF